MQALLEGDRDDEHEAAEAAEVGEGDAEAAPHLGDAQQGGRHQRGAAEALGPTLDQGEGGGEHGEQGEQQPGPQRPAGGAALHQWHQQGEQGGGEQDRPGDVDLGALRGAALRDEAQGEDEGEQGEGDVQQEDRAPAGAEEVRGDQHPAEHLPDDHRDAADRAVDREGAPAPGAVGGGGDGAEDLGDQQGGRRALGGPGGDQAPCSGGESAGERGHGEGGRSDHEEAAPAEDVPESSAEDEEDGEGDAVPGGDQLQDGGPGTEVVVDGRQGDIHYEEVKHREERPEQDGDQSGCTEGRGGERRRSGGVGGGRGGGGAGGGG